MHRINLQIKGQDFVDNEIFQLLEKLNPVETRIEWDIELIGNSQDSIKNIFVYDLKLTDEKTFYAFLEA